MSGNPFAATTGVANPFQAAKPPPPTINQLRSQTTFPSLPSNDLHGLNFNLQPNSNTANNQPLMNSGSMAAGFSMPGNNPFAM